MKSKILNKLKNKSFVISLLSFVIFIQFFVTCLYDGITNWKPSIDTNSAVDYDALRQHLSSWYFIFFWTDYTITFASIAGMMCYWFWKYKWYRTVLFCAIAFLIFNIFAMLYYRWDTFNIERYGSYKTISCHLIWPITFFILLFWIRKDILLNTKWMIICSFYFTIFFIVTMIIYYSITYIDNNGELKNLTIYEFLDFNNKIMIFPTKNIYIRIFVIIFLTLLTPIAAFGVFIVFKFIFNVKIRIPNLSFNKKTTIKQQN